MILGSVLLALVSLVPASAQTTGLIGGGLTALPNSTLGPNLLSNGGFETMSGSAPAAWSTGKGWGVDQLIKHSGSFSYRATANFASATQTVALKKGVYKLSGWIRTQGISTGTTRGVRLQFDRRPAVGEWKQTDLIGGTRDWTLFEVENLVVTEDAVVTIRLENFNNTAGTVWFDDLKLEEHKGSDVEAFMLYPNFRGMLFDDQSQTMKFDLTVTPPGGDFGGYGVRGVLKDEVSGQELLSRDYAAAPNFVADLEGGSMQPGRAYLVTFSLVNRSNNTVVSSYPAYRVSKVPGATRTSMNVSFDAKNRVLVHGVPRFVLGVYDNGMSYNTTDAFWEDLLVVADRRASPERHELQLLSQLLVRRGARQCDEVDDGQPRQARRHVSADGELFRPVPGRFAVPDQWLRRVRTRHRCAPRQCRLLHDRRVHLDAHPGRLRPVRSAAPAGSRQPHVHDQLRSAGPRAVARQRGHPVDRPVPAVQTEPSGGYNHGEVGDWTAKTRDAVKDARPVMTVLQFFKFTPQGRFPTLPEMRNHAWMAIVEGARGSVLVEPRCQRAQRRLRGLVRPEDGVPEQPQDGDQRGRRAGAGHSRR